MVAWSYILLLVVALPLLAARSAHALAAPGGPRPSRASLHFNTLAMLFILLGLTVAVARKEGIDLFTPWRPGWIDIVSLIVFLGLTLTSMSIRIARLQPAQRERLELITMSDWREPRQLLPYAAVCIMAGIAEETAYRGLLTTLLEGRTGSVLASVGIACIAFGAAHSVQGWTGVILASLFAALFHAVVAVTGNLYAAIVGHVLYDLAAGIVIAETAMRQRAAVARA